MRRPLAHLLGPPFLPPLRPLPIFPNSNFRIPLSTQFAARESRVPAAGADWAVVFSLSRCAPYPQTRPTLTSDFDRGRISGPSARNGEALVRKGSTAQPGGAMPCGPTLATMRPQSKEPGRARTCDLQVKGLRFLQVFSARLLLEPACYLSRRQSPRPPMPGEGASQRERSSSEQ